MKKLFMSAVRRNRSVCFTPSPIESTEWDLEPRDLLVLSPKDDASGEYKIIVTASAA
jgi:hypothetical protein